MYLGGDLLPAQDCQKRLIEIASHPTVVGQVVVLPDVFCKNKNFVPGGVAIATRGALVPMFCGPTNDSIAVFRTDFQVEDLDSDTLDSMFASLQRKVQPFRREAPSISEDEALASLGNPQNKLRETWEKAVSGGQLVHFPSLVPGENGEEGFSTEQIFEAFPNVRPRNLPDYVPWLDPVQAARHCMGVLDGGSHFMEVCSVEEVYSKEVAHHFGLEPGVVVGVVHAGSADVGLLAQRQFAKMEGGRSETLPVNSIAAVRYSRASGIAARHAIANRLSLITSLTQALEEATSKEGHSVLVSDAPHDLVEMVNHDDEPVFLHRKGAVRALPASQYAAAHPYGRFGKPFFFPSSPGNDSFLMINSSGHPDSFFTCSHGAGRSMAADEASERFEAEEVKNFSLSRNVRLYSFGRGSLASQAEAAFKPMEVVRSTLVNMGLANPVVRFRPLAVIKT